jgi:hypothetical protein
MSVIATEAPVALWDRITCAIDGSAAGFEAAREAAWLMPVGSQLTLRTVSDYFSPDSVHAFLQDIEAAHATMVCVASGRSGLVPTLALNPLVLAVLRHTEYSVLIVHEKQQGHRRDGAIVVAHEDGGFGALSVAHELADRRALALRILEDPEPTAGTVLAACNGAELLVIESRAKAGALSEQVVRRAGCPVLIVRRPLLGEQPAR